MTLLEFKESLAGDAPPEGVETALQALWWDANGDWARAHELAQDADSRQGDWVHAYLHRAEGDAGNARYWYGRAGQPVFEGGLAEEWDAISAVLLGV